MKYRVKHICEYLFMRVIVALLRGLPYRASLLTGWIIAWLTFHVARFRANQARARIREVFGEKFSPREANRIAWISWRNFVFCIVDMTRLPRLSAAWLEKHVDGYTETTKQMLAHCRSGRGGILASPHMGSWELAGVAMQLADVPIFFITGRQKNPLVDAYLNRLRGETGIATVQRGSAMLKGVIRRLKEGGILAFLYDVRMATEGVRVTFLGKEANVVGGMALFARQTGVPILPGVVTRNGWTRHTFRLLDPVVPDAGVEKHVDWQRMTQEVFDKLEEEIRKQPEQWFWFNKRWILDPFPRETAG
jgi:KDO2-lipid IV(A) lauroyltransferase